MDLTKLSSIAGRLVAACLEWCLRVFAVPCSLLIRNRMGERYVGVSGVLGLLLLWAWTLWSDGNGLLYMLLAACLVQIIVMRVQSIRRRAGGTPIHTRSAGEPLLAKAIPLPSWTVLWIEPFALFVAALFLGLISSPLGQYLELASVALLLLTALQSMTAYYRTLDAVDERIEQKLPVAQVIDLPAPQPNRPFIHEQEEPLLVAPFAPHRIPSPLLPTMALGTQTEAFVSDH